MRPSSGRERSPSVSEGDDGGGQGGHIGHIPGPPPQPGPVPPGGAVRIREARVAKPHASPVLSERHLMSVYRDERTIKEQMELKHFEEIERSLNMSAPRTDLNNGPVAHYNNHNNHSISNSNYHRWIF